MVSNLLFLTTAIGILLTSNSFAAPVDTPFFRHDYTYVESTQTFYKEHKTPATWADAVSICIAEGAYLSLPISKKHANKLINVAAADSTKMWIGLHDQFLEGVYVNLNGEFPAYVNWNVNEPVDVDGNEDCTEMTNLGMFNSVACVVKNRYICSIENSKVIALLNPPKPGKKPFFRDDYTYVAETETFYKEHYSPTFWFDAVYTCNIEGASLAFPASNAETTVLLSLLTDPTKTAWIGLHDHFSEGRFVTVSGRRSDFINWGSAEPNNLNGNESCVQLYSTGIANDNVCAKRFVFVCSKRFKDLPKTETNIEIVPVL